MAYKELIFSEQHCLYSITNQPTLTLLIQLYFYSSNFPSIPQEKLLIYFLVPECVLHTLPIPLDIISCKKYVDFHNTKTKKSSSLIYVNVSVTTKWSKIKYRKDAQKIRTIMLLFWTTSTHILVRTGKVIRKWWGEFEERLILKLKIF